MTNTALTLVALALLALAAYTKPQWRKWWYSRAISFPSPDVKRTDLLFGYFGCLDDQVAETMGAFNLLHEMQFDGVEKCIANILQAKTTTLLDCEHQLFERIGGAKNTVRLDATSRLQAFFELLQKEGALQYVKILSAIDEPNNTVADSMQLYLAVKVLNQVAIGFPELAGYKLSCIYSEDKPFMHPELFDFVGFDDYDAQAHTLVSKKYKALVDSLLPHQRTLIIPGGCYGQDPTPFVNFAQTHHEVGIVMPFLWLDDKGGSVGALGIRSGPLRDLYLAIGRNVVGAD